VVALIGFPLAPRNEPQLERFVAERLQDVRGVLAPGDRNPRKGLPPMKRLVGPVTFEKAVADIRTELMERYSMEGMHARATGSRVRCLVSPIPTPWLRATCPDASLCSSGPTRRAHSHRRRGDVRGERVEPP
jgi:hypothetical protein